MKKVLGLSILAVLLIALGSILMKKSQVVYDIEEQVICGESYIAYITDEEKVFMITEEGTAYVPEAEGVRKIFGYGSAIILLLNDGSIKVYDWPSGLYVTGDNYESHDFEYYIPLCNLIEAQGNVDDLFCIDGGCIGVYKEGQWISYPSFIEIDNDAIKIIGNCPEPEMWLKSDGTVAASCGNVITEIMEKKIESWTDVKDIAIGFAPFALLSNGTVVTVFPNPQDAADIEEWQDICYLTAAPYITAGLTADGKVLVRSPKDDAILQAEEWKNVCFVKAFSNYLFGVDKDGRLLLTESKSSHLRISEEIEYPLPIGMRE